MTANIFAACAFFVILAIGLVLSSLRDRARNAPARRINERLRRILPSEGGNAGVARSESGTALFNLEQRRGRLRSWFRQYADRVRTASGRSGLRIIGASAVAGVAAAVLAIELFEPPGAMRPLIYLGLPLFAVRLGYRALIMRFRARFLEALPDTIDLIVRSARAGIPVTQAISNAGDGAVEPVRSTFRVMGDSLRLGMDLKDVLNQAAERLLIADFSLFTVYLLLQRETGGSLGETLDELSAIIRTRRDIRLKSRALTAEGRITTNIISVMPFLIIGVLYVVNRPYVELLFTTNPGHTMLTTAAVMLMIGLVLIRKLSKLDTSR
ncbi:type II secretion system F family protein [Burkholderia mayonis]|uniref:Pilus assembly protein n=1 Tax=Burkholderia mayonis TaxID=1385591 RepID=A0A1B4G6A5_9BURK|nr:type II secretion system F family protein [Burkholderia mayonis]AOJ11451.1 pilus assembly protein [Burkholderia mayonis]KVE46426.1 pilus assembly protein [Burkholderia mayonis]